MESATIAPGASEEEQRKMAEQAKAADAEAAKKNGAGGEPLEGEGEQAQADQPKGPPPVELEGLGKQLSLKINGGQPDTAVATLQGGAMKIPAGEFNPGDVIEAVVRLRCTSVEIRDNTNHSTGEVSERARKHKFKLLSIERTSR